MRANQSAHQSFNSHYFFLLIIHFQISSKLVASMPHPNKTKKQGKPKMSLQVNSIKEKKNNVTCFYVRKTYQIYRF